MRSSNHLSVLNKNSYETLNDCMVELSIKNDSLETVYQFERQGYFKLLKKGDVYKFHRVVNLKDTWQK